MAARLTFRLLLAVAAFSGTGFAQTSQTPSNPPCPAQGQQVSQPQSKPCTPARQPTTAEQFPFPGEQEKPASANQPDAPGSRTTPADAASEHPFPGGAEKSAAPDAPGANSGARTTPSDAVTQHPFPTTPAPPLPGADSSNSSSSSSSSSSSGNPDEDGTPDLAPGSEGTSVHRHPLPKVTHVQTEDERVDEDINVAMFYLRDENFAGAYLRAQDAIKTQPDYSLAHFTLAQVAQKMKKKDEAIAEYKAYLKLDPDGEKKKEALRALDALK